MVPSQLSAIYNNLFLSLFLSLSFSVFLSFSFSPLSPSIPSHSTCSSTKTRWRVMPATTIVCCVTTRPRPSSTWSSMCVPWSTSAVRASGSFSAYRRACRRKRRTSAPSSPFANALLQIQVRTCSCGHVLVSLHVCLSCLFYSLSRSTYATLPLIHINTHSMPELLKFAFTICHFLSRELGIRDNIYYFSMALFRKVDWGVTVIRMYITIFRWEEQYDFTLSELSWKSNSTEEKDSLSGIKLNIAGSYVS